MTAFIGDVHGQYDALSRLLRDAHLVDAHGHWAGGTEQLWFAGDFCDRGPDGVGVLDLVMRLQTEAAAVGGHVGAVLGNHDVVVLGVRRWGDLSSGLYGSFRAAWLANGGQPHDLARLTPAHAHWLAALPAMALLGTTLLTHCDATFYNDYGATLPAINAGIAAALQSDEIEQWDALLERMSQRKAFWSGAQAEGGSSFLAEQFLAPFGAHRLVHGHTPIPLVRRVDPRAVTTAFVYANGRCANVDGGLYLGGPGFVYRQAD